MKHDAGIELISRIGKELNNPTGNIYGLLGRILDIISGLFPVRFGRIFLESGIFKDHAVEVSHCGPEIDPVEACFEAEHVMQEAADKYEPVKSAPKTLNCIPEKSCTEKVNSADACFYCAPVIISEKVMGTITLCIGNDSSRDPFSLETAGIISSMISRFLGGFDNTGRADDLTYQLNIKDHNKKDTYAKRVVMIGNSSAGSEIEKKIKHFAGVDAPALIYGECGTGKEYFAELIHMNSSRSGKPFSVIHLSNMPSDMIEPELFGFCRNNSAGSGIAVPGRIDKAEGGTLFIDEIACLPLTAQARLSRLIRNRDFARVGASTFNNSDVRIITSTSCDLNELISQKRFSEELFFLLNADTLCLTPHRGRKSDIRLLADFFLERYASFMGKKISRFSPEATGLLISHNWPGNIHELENCIERAVISCDEDVIRYNHLPPSLQRGMASETDQSLEEKVGYFEKELIVDSLRMSGGNISDAARMLKTTKRILGYKIQRLGIDYKQFLNP